MNLVTQFDRDVEEACATIRDHLQALFNDDSITVEIDDIGFDRYRFTSRGSISLIYFKRDDPRRFVYPATVSLSDDILNNKITERLRRGKTDASGS